MNSDILEPFMWLLVHKRLQPFTRLLISVIFRQLPTYHPIGDGQIQQRICKA